MCETINPNVPVSGMGPIEFPSEEKPGSGDVIAAPKTRKKRQPYKQKPSHQIMSFDEFFNVTAKNSSNDAQG